MKRRISEIPGTWVVLKVPQEDNTIIYKIFAGWRGGYLDGDRWKMNSGITKVEEDEDNFYFYGFSGSCYKCHKKGYGLKDGLFYFGSFPRSVLEQIIENAKEKLDCEIEIMDQNTNWIELFEDNTND